MMSDQRKKTPEQQIVELANRMCDQTISTEERKRLESLLDEHPDLRPRYLDYMRVNAGLIWRYRTGDAQAEDQTEVVDARPVDQSGGVSAKSTASNANREWRSYLTGRWAFVGAVASCLLIAMLLSPDDEVDAPKAIIPAGTFVATLHEATHVVWGNSNQAINVGSRIGTGKLRLDAGEAELVFDSGAKLRLAGPAEMTLESPLSVFLAKGAVAAHMPPEAIGFELRTPMSTLVDQGTEFGVSVNEIGETQVHVFHGQVDLLYGDVENSGDAPARLKMFDRHARKIQQPGGIGEEIAFSKATFGGLARRVADPVEWKIADGGNGHFYQLVVEKRPVTWHEAAQRAMALYFRGMPGHLVTMTSREEDQFVIANVLEELTLRGVWTGLTDVLGEGQYRWVTGEPYEFTNWATFPVQQPDNFHEADWHGGEDYGMYAQFPGKQPWAWNDLSIDSMHEKISAYIVEYESPVASLRHRSMALDPIHWPKSEGGNGHYYRMVLVLEPVDWNTIRERAADSKLHGAQGQLVAMETAEEREFVADSILRVCGIPEMMIGLSGSLEQGNLRWVNGLPVTGFTVEQSHLPTDWVYGVFRWNPAGKWQTGWEIRAMSMDVLPADWFGYLIEYPVELSEENL